MIRKDEIGDAPGQIGVGLAGRQGEVLPDEGGAHPGQELEVGQYSEQSGAGRPPQTADEYVLALGKDVTAQRDPRDLNPEPADSEAGPDRPPRGSRGPDLHLCAAGASQDGLAP